MSSSRAPLTPSRGFTLIELVVTVAILGLLAAIATPSFVDAIRRNTLATQTNELSAALALARTEAIRRNGRAGVCPSNDDQSDCSTEAADWTNGWLVWSGETDQVVSAFRLDSDVLSAVHTGVVFGDRGQRLEPAAANTFLLKTYACEEGEQKARQISILGSGQVTVAVTEC